MRLTNYCETRRRVPTRPPPLHLWASCFSCEGQFDLVVDYEGGAQIRLTDHYRVSAGRGDDHRLMRRDRTPARGFLSDEDLADIA
jgi:hypothetical protein